MNPAIVEIAKITIVNMSLFLTSLIKGENLSMTAFSWEESRGFIFSTETF